MKRARFTKEQIIAVLREHEAGAKTSDLAREHGNSKATFYNWKAQYGGMDASEAKRLKQLEEENATLKRLLAETMLDASALRELLAKKMVGPAAKREGVAHLQAVMGLSERRACSIVNADRKMVRYRSRRAPDTALRRHSAISRMSAAGLAIGASSSCCVERASAPASTALIVSTARKASPSVEASFGVGLRNPGCLRGQSHRNGRSAAQPRPASPIARCSTPATRLTKLVGSSRRWMKDQRQVSSPLQ